jgi:CBS domain-containing membrane protein
MFRAITVGELMSKRPIYVKEDDDLATVYDLMRETNVRHVPVVSRDESVTGVISQNDLIRKVLYRENVLPKGQVQEILAGMTARSIMTQPVQCVNPFDLIEDAASLLLRFKFGCLPVTENGILVGILTEADFVKFARKICSDEKSAEQVPF